MKQPLILIDDGDVALFESVEDLEHYVESPDISNYKVFDAEGQRVNLTEASPIAIKQRLFGAVSVSRIVASNSCISAVEELEELLRVFLHRVTGNIYDNGALPELLKVLQAKIGYTR